MLLHPNSTFASHINVDTNVLLYTASLAATVKFTLHVGLPIIPKTSVSRYSTINLDINTTIVEIYAIQIITLSF